MFSSLKDMNPAFCQHYVNSYKVKKMVAAHTLWVLTATISYTLFLIRRTTTITAPTANGNTNVANR